MPVVQAYQCPYTLKLFAIDQQDKYKKHLRKVATERYNNRKAEQLVREQEAYLDNTLRSSGTIAEIEEWFQDNGLWLARNAFINDSWSDKSRYYKHKVEPFKFKSFRLKVSYRGHINNSHSAPKGKPENWGRDPNLPTGYPGWVGSVRYEIEKEHRAGGSSMFKGTGIYIGTGGSSNGTSYGYEVILWEDDWLSLSVMRKLTENG